MSVSRQRNMGIFEAVAAGGTLTPIAGISATSTGNSGTTNIYRGATIDRTLQRRRYLSAKIAYTVNAILGSSTGNAPANFTITPGVQDSADGNTWADYATDAPGVADTRYAGGASASSASSTGTPAVGQAEVDEYNVDLSRARRYIRCQATAAVGSSSTATAAPGVSILATWIFGGADAVPAT